MRYHDISLDELEELEQQIHFQAENSQRGMDYSKLELYDAMHSHLKLLAAEDEDYQNYLNYIQRKLINYLLCYGGLPASADAKQRFAAECALKKVLQYDPANQLAAYRLARLYLQQHLYKEALCLLQQSLDNQPEPLASPYKLNAGQIKRALLSMTSCSLHLSSRAFAASTARSIALASDEFSSIFSQLQNCSAELKNSSYQLCSADRPVLCGYEQTLAAIEQQPKDTIILFFNTEGPELIYNGIQERLPAIQAYLLRHLLLNSNASRPMTPLDVTEYFWDTHVMTGVTSASFTRAAEELMQAMREIEIPSAVCRTEVQKQPAYFFNSTSAFLVIGRVDEEMNLD